MRKTFTPRPNRTLACVWPRAARAGLRQAPGISGPPVASARTTLADCACASPRSEVAAAAARIDGSTGSGFQPDRARCGVRRDSGLESLQSGGSASVFLHLRVSVCDAPVGVTDPETQQILWHSLLAKMSHTVSPKGMEAAFLAAHLSQDLV